MDLEAINWVGAEHSTVTYRSQFPLLAYKPCSINISLKRLCEDPRWFCYPHPGSGCTPQSLYYITNNLLHSKLKLYCLLELERLTVFAALVIT